MLKTVKDACVLHENAIDFSMADHIENLHEVIEGEQDGAAFFEQTFITHRMDQLFRQGLKRLAGKSNDGVFQLTQAMGGGKTHLLRVSVYSLSSVRIKKSHRRKPSAYSTQ